MFSPSIPTMRCASAARGALAALSASVLLLLAACAADTAGGEQTADAAAVEAAQERLAPYLAPITKIPVSTPLTSRPEGGKKVYFIRYNLPVAAALDGPLVEAAKALDWEVRVITADGSDPQAVSNAAIRAVTDGADYIAVSSGNAYSLGPGLEEAKQAGIPVFFMAGSGEPEGAKNGIYGNVGSAETPNGTVALLDQMIIDSKGGGSALLLNAPDYPVLAPINDLAEAHLAENCSACSLQITNISPADLGGDVASTAVASIRQNPRIKYVVGAFDALVMGLPEALAAAGLDDVKVLVGAPNEAMVEGIHDGTYRAGAMYPMDGLAWLTIDMMARHSLGMELDDEAHAYGLIPIWTAENAPEGETYWQGPPDLEAQFKELWQID